VNSNLISREIAFGSRVKSVAEESAYRIEGKSLGTLQANCTSIYNKTLEF
jgi:hypothetical protein